MKYACPLCSSTATRVYDHDRDATGLVRRRRCETCGARWLTEETFVRLVQDSTDALGTGTRYWTRRLR